MNKDERSAASTGADTERHRSNDLNPTSAPALSLPIQRLGSAMEGYDRFDALLGFLESQKFHPDASHVPPDFRDGYNHALRAVMERVETERGFHVEALRQRPGAQAASEPDEFIQGVNAAAAMLDKKADDYAAEHSTQDSDTGVWEFGRHGEDYYNTLRELADDVRSIVHGNAASPAGERPAQAEPMTDEQIDAEAEALTWHDGDSPRLDHRAFARAILASPSARERPGAQAPSTAALTKAAEQARDALEWVTTSETFYRDPRGDRAGPAIDALDAALAAPSTGGAETAALYGFDRENLEAVAEGLATGYEASINVGNVTGMGDDHLESTTAYAARFIRTVLASSAPAQAVETAGVREQDFEKGWRTAANWMERDDLIADIGSAAYLKDRAAALQSPAASPASKEDGSHE